MNAIGIQITAKTLIGIQAAWLLSLLTAAVSAAAAPITTKPRTTKPRYATANSEREKRPLHEKHLRQRTRGFKVCGSASLAPRAGPGTGGRPGGAGQGAGANSGTASACTHSASPSRQTRVEGPRRRTTSTTSAAVYGPLWVPAST
jgi:hypothetical protein